MSEQNAMQKAIAAAEAAAANTPAVIEGNTGVSAAPAAKPSALSLDDFKRETPSVDAWVKVAVDGFTIRDEKVAGFTEATLKTTMVLEDLVVCKRLRWGNPASYAASYDGVYATDGQLWSVVIDNARRATGDASIKDYMSMNVQATLREDAGGAKTGDVIGYQTTPTQNKNLNSLIKTAEAAGIAPDQEFDVEIGVQQVSNSKGNKWAIQTYEFVGPTA